jgi:hypothetical protein
MRQPGSGLAVMGARRSEVKEEDWAQPNPGDTSAGGYTSPSTRGTEYGRLIRKQQIPEASDPQMLLQQLRLAAQRVRCAGEHHFALDQDHVAVGDLGHVFPVLVDDHAADAARGSRRRCARSRGRSAGPGLRWPRPGSARRGWSSGRGRWSASAARRRELLSAVAQALLEPREGVEHALVVQSWRRPAPSAALPVGPARAAILRFSTTLRLPKMPRPSGT